jgi:hypothetical protein
VRDAGGNESAAQFLGQEDLVDARQHLCRVGGAVGGHSDRVPRSGGNGRRFLALAADIADGQPPSGRSAVDVVKVGADLDTLRGSDIGSRELDSGDLRQAARQQAGLQRIGYLGAATEQMVDSDGEGQLLAEFHPGADHRPGHRHRLINELLTFSRVGQPGTIRGPVDLNSVASEAVDRLDATIADTDAEVVVGELPTVTGDATLLTQLFQNLIANSIKFRQLDERPLVRITAEHKDGHWEFACQDNGIGIAPANAERVFVIFQRLHPRDAYPGTGIGLALCRKIVEFHGGNIWVDTQATPKAGPGPGTTIRWTMPESDEQKEGT